MGGNISSPVVDEELRNSIFQLKQKVEAGDAPSEQEDLGSFAAREAEWSRLVGALAGESTRVTLLLGPRDSGKSSLLRHLKQKWESTCQVRKIFSPFLLINLHECHSVDSEGGIVARGLYSAVHKEASAWLDMAMVTLNSSTSEHIGGIPRASISRSLKSFSESLQRSVFNLSSLMASFQASLIQNRHVRPVIVLDEAQGLKPFCTYTKTLHEIQKLAQFSVWLCKEFRGGHVVMASSAPFFWSWLLETLEVRLLKMIPVGHFSALDAKKFLMTCVLPKHQGYLPEGGFSEDLWKSVYQVAGGSPHLLKIVASDAVELGSWTDALQSMLSAAAENLRETVLELMRYEEFTHFEGIVGAIIDGEGLAGFNKIMVNVFAGDESTARRLIKRLAEKSVVDVRLWTSGMKYMDVGEKPGDDTLYVMAADPASYAAMKKLYPSWFATINPATRKQDKEARKGWKGSNIRRNYSRRESDRDFSQGGSEGDLDMSGGEWD